MARVVINLPNVFYSGVVYLLKYYIHCGVDCGVDCGVYCGVYCGVDCGVEYLNVFYSVIVYLQLFSSINLKYYIHCGVDCGVEYLLLRRILAAIFINKRGVVYLQLCLVTLVLGFLARVVIIYLYLYLQLAELNRLQQVTTGYNRLPQVTTGYHRLPVFLGQVDNNKRLFSPVDINKPNNDILHKGLINYHSKHAAIFNI